MNAYFSVACKAIALSAGITFAIAAPANELADSAAAASKAAAAAEAAAKQAMSAAKAANEAAAAARKALAASNESATNNAAATPAATAPATAAATTTSTSTATAGSGDSSYAEHVQCEGKNCKIDIFLTRGFRAFSQCQVCHGLDGNGSTIGPSLVDKLKSIDRARFDDVVANGLKGQIGVMPPWKTNPNVMKYIDNLYAYLKARSDGVLPAGKLKRFDR